MVTGISIASLVSKMNETTMTSRNTSFKNKLFVLIISKITQDIPLIKLDTNHFNTLDHITLTDPTYYTSSNTDLLLEAEIFYNL